LIVNELVLELVISIQLSHYWEAEEDLWRPGNNRDLCIAIQFLFF